MLPWSSPSSDIFLVLHLSALLLYSRSRGREFLSHFCGYGVCSCGGYADALAGSTLAHLSRRLLPPPRRRAYVFKRLRNDGGCVGEIEKKQREKKIEDMKAFASLFASRFFCPSGGYFLSFLASFSVFFFLRFSLFLRVFVFFRSFVQLFFV